MNLSKEFILVLIIVEMLMLLGIGVGIGIEIVTKRNIGHIIIEICLSIGLIVTIFLLKISKL